MDGGWFGWTGGEGEGRWSCSFYLWPIVSLWCSHSVAGNVLCVFCPSHPQKLQFSHYLMLKGWVCAAVFVTSSKTLSLSKTVSLISDMFLLLAHFLYPSSELAFLCKMLHIFGWHPSLCLPLHLSCLPLCPPCFLPACVCITHAGIDVWVGVGTYWQLPGNRLAHHFIIAQNSLHGNHR